MAGVYTIGNGFTYATIALGVAAMLTATGGNFTGEGVHQLQVNPAVADAPYAEDVDIKTTISNTSNTNHPHLIGMVDKTGQMRDGIIINKNNSSVTTGVLCAAYSRVTNISVTNSGAAGAHNKFGIHGGVAGVVLDRVFVYTLRCAVSVNPAYGIYLGYGSVVKNCTVSNILGGSVGYGIRLDNVGTNIGLPAAYFCTANNVSAQGVNLGRGMYLDLNGFIARNCIVVGSKSVDFATGGTPDVTYCISEDPTADDWGGAGNQVSQDPITDVKLTNIADGSEDFHISDASSSAQGAGVAIGGITTDFEGDTRANPPYIGADELPAGGGDRKGIMRGVGRGIYRGVG